MSFSSVTHPDLELCQLYIFLTRFLTYDIQHSHIFIPFHIVYFMLNYVSIMQILSSTQNKLNIFLYFGHMVFIPCIMHVQLIQSQYETVKSFHLCHKSCFWCSCEMKIRLVVCTEIKLSQSSGQFNNRFS